MPSFVRFLMLHTDLVAATIQTVEGLTYTQHLSSELSVTLMSLSIPEKVN